MSNQLELDFEKYDDQELERLRNDMHNWMENNRKTYALELEKKLELERQLDLERQSELKYLEEQRIRNE